MPNMAPLTQPRGAYFTGPVGLAVCVIFLKLEKPLHLGQGWGKPTETLLTL